MTLTTAPSVTVVGSANVDFVMRLPKLPAPGETVTEGEFQQVFGGKGANCAVAAARSASAPGSVAFVARLGEDLFGPRMLENFSADGMDVRHVRLDSDQPCGSALIMVDARGENCIAVAAGANGALTPADIDAARDTIAASKVVLMQMEVPPAVVRRTIEVASEVGAKAVLNYAPVGDAPIAVDAALHGLIVNETEAEHLAGKHDTPAVLAEHLKARGPAFVVVTLGGEGVVVCDDAGVRSFPAFRITPVDTTAAGDTFCGVLGFGLAEGLSLDDAVQRAQAAAALCASAAGAQPSIPTRDRILSMLDAR